MTGSDFTLTEGTYSFSTSAVVQDVKLNQANAVTATSSQNLTVTKSSENYPTINVTYAPLSSGKVGIPFTATVVGADTDGDLTYLEFYILTDAGTPVYKTATSAGASSLTINSGSVTQAMLNMGSTDYSKTIYWYALARDAEGHVTQYSNQAITAARMDIVIIDTIDHVRTPSSPNMVSHYRVVNGVTPPTITELDEAERLPLQFGVSKMTISMLDSLVLAGYKARGYIYTTTSEIFDSTPDVWRAEGTVTSDKMLYLDMVNFWRQVDLDTSKWFVLEVLNSSASSVIVRYIWNIKAYGDTYDPMVAIIDSGKDYREGVPLEFTINATDEFLEAITDLRLLVNIGQSGWKDLEDVVSSMNPSIDTEEGWMYGIRYHVKVQVFPELTDYASGLVDDGVDYIVSNAIASADGVDTHASAKWFDVFHGLIPGMPSTSAGRSEYWWKTDGFGNILREDDDNGQWAGNRTPDEEPYDPTPSDNTDELDHRALAKWLYVYEFTDLDTTRVNEIKKEAFVESTTFKVWIYPEVVRVYRSDIASGVTKPQVIDVVDVSIGPGTWRDQHVDYRMQIQLADWRWGGNNPDTGKVTQFANFTIDEDEETPQIEISGSYSLDGSSFKHLFKDQWEHYSPVKNYPVPNFFVHSIEVFTGAEITIKANDDIALNDLLVFYDSDYCESDCLTSVGSPKASFVGRTDAFSYPTTGFDYVYKPGMQVYKLVSGSEGTGEATLITLVKTVAESSATKFPILEDVRGLRIFGQDFAMNGTVITPTFTLDNNYEYYANFTNDDVVDSWAIAAHSASFNSINDIIKGTSVNSTYEDYAGEYSTIFNGAKFTTTETEENGKASFTFQVPDIAGDYWLWIVARDRSAQDTSLFDYPIDSRHDYDADTYLGEYPTYATKNRQCDIFGTLVTDGNPNFDYMYYDDSMSEDDADMVILLRLRIKPHSWDIVRMDIHEPNLISYPVKDECLEDIWYMHSYHPIDPPHEFDESDLKVPVYRLPRDLYPVYKQVPLKNTDPIGLYHDGSNLRIETDADYNLWKVTDWVDLGRGTEQYSSKVRIEGVPVVGGADPTDFRVRTHEDITKLSWYLVKGEYWNTEDIEQAYGDLDSDPNVVTKGTMTADNSDRQWGFWEWTLDWDALGLTDLEATYTIAVRGYHTTSDLISYFYEQFQWPIFVDTLGPRLKMYNVLESATETLLPNETLQLNILEEIEQRDINGTDPYPVLDWAALLAIDKGGLYFEESKDVPTDGPENGNCGVTGRNDRRGCEPPYDYYTQAYVDEFFIDTISYPGDCWDFRMTEIRDNDLDNHTVRLWDPCCMCSEYPVFGGYSNLSPIASNSYLLGYPGTSTEVEADYESLELHNSLKYLEHDVTSVEYFDALTVWNNLLDEYMDNIYSEELDNDFWDFYYDFGRLPEVVLFHNIYIKGFCWSDPDYYGYACLGVHMKDELGNLGEWESKVRPTVDLTIEATAAKVGSCRVNTLNATATLNTSKLRKLSIREIPSGSLINKTVSPSAASYSGVFSGVLLPQWETFRTLQFIGTTVDDETPATQTTLEATYAGTVPVLSIGGYSNIEDLWLLLDTTGRSALKTLIKYADRLVVDSGFEETSSGSTYAVSIDFSSIDDNIDEYHTYSPKPTAQATEGLLPYGVAAVSGTSNTSDDPNTWTSVARLYQNDNTALASQHGYILFSASATDCPGDVTSAATELRVWYQNLDTFLVSADATGIGPGNTATGVEVVFQSDLLFSSKTDIINNIVIKVNNVEVTKLDVLQWDENTNQWVAVSGQGRNDRFLFIVPAYTPVASRIDRDLKPRLGTLITIQIVEMVGAAKGLIEDWEANYQALDCNELEAIIEAVIDTISGDALTTVATPISDVAVDHGAKTIEFTLGGPLTLGALIDAIVAVAGPTAPDVVFPIEIDSPSMIVMGRAHLYFLRELFGDLEITDGSSFTVTLGNPGCNLGYTASFNLGS
jgi:hypothetical protein